MFALPVHAEQIQGLQQGVCTRADRDELLQKYFNRFDYDNTGCVSGEVLLHDHVRCTAILMRWASDLYSCIGGPHNSESLCAHTSMLLPRHWVVIPAQH